MRKNKRKLVCRGKVYYGCCAFLLTSYLRANSGGLLLAASLTYPTSNSLNFLDSTITTDIRGECQSSVPQIQDPVRPPRTQKTFHNNI